MAQRILVTGASGLVGTPLLSLLASQGHDLQVLSRRKKADAPYATFEWDYGKEYLEEGALEGVDTIVHLAGAGVAEKKWTKERKTEILESRTLTSKLLYDELKKGNHQVKTVISASAIGIYGNDTGNAMCKEDSPTGADFLAHVTDAWEASTRRISELGIRVVQLRIGVVLSHRGGALIKLLEPPVAAPLAKGAQYMSWIHVDDLCAMISKAIEDTKMTGPYNAVGPKPLTNKQFTKQAAKAFGKPFLPIPVPKLALKLMLGEMASIVIGGNRVSSLKIEEAGFRFTYPTLDQALEDLSKRAKN